MERERRTERGEEVVWWLKWRLEREEAKDVKEKDLESYLEEREGE